MGREFNSTHACCAKLIHIMHTYTLHTHVQDIHTSHVRQNNTYTVRQCDNVLVMSIIHSSLMDGGNKQEKEREREGGRERER